MNYSLGHFEIGFSIIEGLSLWNAATFFGRCRYGLP